VGFRNLARQRLQNETYLEVGGRTILQIIESESMMIRFEKEKKSIKFNVNNPDLIDRSFYIPGLRENEKKKLRDGSMDLSVLVDQDFFKRDLEI
jgi:hypothetical protein